MIAGIIAFIPPAQAQPTFVAIGVIAYAASGDVTPVIPAHQAYDVLVLMGLIRSNLETVTVSGWTAFSGSPFTRGTSTRYWFFWARATSGSMTAIFDTDGTTAEVYVVVGVFRNAVTTGTPFDVFGTPATGTADPTGAIGGVTTLVDNSDVLLLLGGEDNNNNPGPGTATATNPATFVEHYVDTALGADAMFDFSNEIRLTAGATGDGGYNFNVANPVGWGAMIVSLKPIAAGANGFDSLITMSSTTKAATVGQCANGGNRVFLNISWGLDNGDGAGTARDGVLQAGEVDATNNMIWTACNGAAGAKGDTGAAGINGFNSLIVVSIATVGQCTYGGWLFETGLDDGVPSGTPRNGILEAGEVEYSAAVCNGAPGAAGADGADGTNGTNGANGTDGHNALINITDLSPGDPNCTWGGYHFEGGIDANNDTVLQESEITNETNACNGAPGDVGSSGPPGSDANVNALLYVIGAIVLGCIILAGCLKSTIGMLAFGLASLGLGLLMVGAGLPLIHWVVWIFAGLISCVSSPLGE